jgi:hypothetical protein
MRIHTHGVHIIIKETTSKIKILRKDTINCATFNMALLEDICYIPCMNVPKLQKHNVISYLKQRETQLKILQMRQHLL